MRETLEQIAPWVAIHLSALSGQVFTVPQLLGRGKQDKEDRVAEAQKSAAALEKRLAKAKATAEGGGTWQAVE